ncbi:ubiquitin-specific protease 23, partial [Prunus dulcis]
KKTPSFLRKIPTFWASTMADALIHKAELQSPSDGYSDLMPESETGSSVPQRRIEFHLARKPFNGLNNGGGDFRLETLNPEPAARIPGQSGLSAKKTDGSEFLENGLDPELSFGITFRRIGAGLMNMGNTCYLNSVLQCLTYTEPLAAYLQSGKHRNSCEDSSHKPPLPLVWMCMQQVPMMVVPLASLAFFNMFWQHEYGLHLGLFDAIGLGKWGEHAILLGFVLYAPSRSMLVLRYNQLGGVWYQRILSLTYGISRNFTKSRQEDAHEYMVNLLESMHKCCLPSGVPSESSSAYEKSLVHKIFGGRLRSQVKCLQCSCCSNKFDPFLDLSLEIFKADSLQKALGNFTAAEQLDGGERQYQCQQCKQKVRALKQMTVHKPPYVLTIHLKRFRAHDPGRKIDRHVKFGPTLDLRPFVSGSYEGDLKYTLYGVLVHCGASTYSGHYYCYVRTSSGMWYSLDDNQVFQVSERIVLEQKAYMLFYVRDRRNIIPRKPVEVARKENFNSAGFKNRSTSNQGSKELVQNVSVEGRSSGLASSVVAIQKDESNIVPPMVPLLKGASVKSQITAEKMDPLKELSLPNPKLGKYMLQSSSFPSSNGGASDPEIATAATTDANKNDLNKRGSSIENSGVSIVIATNVKDPESLEAAKPIPDEASPDNNIIPSAGDSHTGSSGVRSGKKIEGIQTSKSSDQPSSKISQIGSLNNEGAAGHFLGEKTISCGQKVVVDESVKLSGSSIVTNGLLHVKAPDCRRHRKLKKKQMKSKVACMHLRPSLLSRAVLSVQKKKKHKRSKHPTSDTQTLSKEHLMDSSRFLSDLGPSTSEKTQSISLVSTLSKRKSKRKRTKSGLKKDADGTAENGESRESLHQNGTVLASDKRLENGCGSSPAQWKTSVRRGELIAQAIVKQTKCKMDGPG